MSIIRVVKGTFYVLQKRYLVRVATKSGSVMVLGKSICTPELSI